MHTGEPLRRGPRVFGFLLAALLFLLGLDLTVAAQEEPAELGLREEVAVGWVHVPVVVRSRGGYVPDLEQEDFRLFVDGRPVPIAEFEAGSDAPVTVVFLQDLSGSMGIAGKLDESREAIRFFLEAARPGDRYALASFANGELVVEVPFTTDLQPIHEAIDLWEPYGTTALHDAVFWLPDITLGADFAKRAAILITDGVDNASAIAPVTARQRVRGAELPVYVLGLATGSPDAVDSEGRKLYRYADLLDLLASLSGGRYFAVVGPYELKEACVAIRDDLRHQYVLGFATTGTAQPGPHQLRVEVARRADQDLTVTHRKSYRGGAPDVR
jgi:Ca-activated chloride channel family protein